MRSLYSSVLVLSGFQAALFGQSPPRMLGSGDAAVSGPAAKLQLFRPSRPRQAANPPNQACRTINFAGLGNLEPINTFDGISSTGWVAGISFAVPGGTAQFTGAPDGGYTVAVFLSNSGNINDTIHFAIPVSSVSFFYATGFDTTITAFDVSGQPVGSAAAPSDYVPGTGYYNNWLPLTINADKDVIDSINITSANPLSNFFGLDELQYCTSLAIDSVEMTQAIQQLQPLATLQSNLNNGIEPPVPVIAGKPGAMRVYMKDVFEVTLVNITLAIPGYPSETKLATLQPGCTPPKQRLQTCPSTDFYFTPPAGSWTATLTLSVPGTGAVISQTVLPFSSRTTQPVVLVPVRVCDDTTFGIFGCSSRSKLASQIEMLKKITPSSLVTTALNFDTIFESHSPYSGCTTAGACNDIDWWKGVVSQLGLLYAQNPTQSIDVGWIGAPDIVQNPYLIYFGVVRPIVTDLGGFSNLGSPNHASAAAIPNLDFTPAVDVTQGTVAHESGHSMTLRHTNSPVPNSFTSPGCWAGAKDSGTDWPWKATSNSNLGSNQIQSSTGFEVPFDVALQKASAGESTYEIMSYCDPRWIAPQRFDDEVLALGGGPPPASFVAGPAAPHAAEPRPRISGPQPYWIVSGSIPASGPAQFDPLFERTLSGIATGGTGAYTLEVRNAGGTPLLTQHFDLHTWSPEEDGVGPSTATSFLQLVPVTPGAASIVLLDPTSAVLTFLNLGGTAPTVKITNPTAAFDGSTAITWTITDPDSADFTSRVFYSPDNGTTWWQLGQVVDSGTSLNADFSTLPGTNGHGLIQVLVSDGVNTGQAISPNFSIARKVPSLVQILSPAPNFAQTSADPLQLSGAAWDDDDGVLAGAALAWSSNLQGPLGTGADLAVGLQAGVHIITLTATDSDGNSVHTEVTVTIGGAPPALNVSSVALTVPPASPSACIQATVTAAPGALGAPLRSVQYSIDGGATFTSIPLGQLPFTFVIPGTGFLNILFTATDISNQTTASSGSFFNQFACSSLAVPNVVGMAQAAAATALQNAALVVGTVTTAASATVAAGSVIGQNPAAGARIAPGASDSVNLTVSSGTQTAVPNVVGLAAAAAAAAITGAGLTVGAVSLSSSTTVPADSVISETPAAGTQAAAGSAVNLIVSAGGALGVAAPAGLPAGTAGFRYQASLSATGGSGNYSWSATGLPAGLTISASGAIAGTPTGNAGSPFSVKVTVTDTTLTLNANRTYSLAVNPALAIKSPGTLPAATAGESYPATTVQATGGSGTYSWSAAGLPAGMIIAASTGIISGTPASAAGSPVAVTITVEDSNAAAANLGYILTIGGPLVITGPSFLPGGTIGAAYPATTATAAGGSGTYTWSATGLPPGLTIAATTGAISGTPTSALGSPFGVSITVNDGSTSVHATFPLAVSAFSPCDVNTDAIVNVADVQRLINEALGIDQAAHDLNNDGVTNVADVEMLVNTLLGGTCLAF